VESARAGIIQPILVGPEARIRDTASKYGLDINGFETLTLPIARTRPLKALS
jgi:phosphate acetyltransferase